MIYGHRKTRPHEQAVDAAIDALDRKSKKQDRLKRGWGRRLRTPCQPKTGNEEGEFFIVRASSSF
jgi:hypothetical protein